MAHGAAHPDPDVVVVGAGIAGLSAGFRLSQGGLSVTVLEAGDDIGGKMGSIRRDGWTLNRAATLLPSSYSVLQKLIADAGGAGLPQLISTRFGIPRQGVLHTLRADPRGQLIDGARTRLLPWSSKRRAARLVADLLRSRAALTYDSVDVAASLDVESVAEYLDRRLDQELGDWIIGPLLRGIFLEEAEQMSVVDLFFTLANLVGGGLLRYPAGIDFACRLLAEPLDVRVGAHVREIKRAGDTVEVTWLQDGVEQCVTAQGCVIAVCGKDVSSIYPELDARQREILGSLDYTAITKAVFGLDRPVADIPTVLAVPKKESSGLGVVCYDSQSMPDSVPSGKAMLSGHWMTEWTRRHLDVSDDQLPPRLFPELDRLIPGLSNRTEFVHVERWNPAAMAPGTGVYKAVAEIRGRVDPDDRVQLAGDYLGMSGTNLSARTGEQAAERLGSALGNRSR